MPKVLNSLIQQGYYSGIDALKSIQHSHRFYVEFIDNPTLEKRLLETEIGPMPLIKPWNIVNVTLPQYPFGKDVIKYGPMAKSFPVMNDFNGFDITVTFEEDSQGTVAYFINWLQRKIIDREKGGVYRSQKVNRIDYMLIQTEDESGIIMQNWLYKNVYFQNASDLSLSYESPTAIRYDITFGSDYMKFLPVKAIPGLVGADLLRRQLSVSLL